MRFKTWCYKQNTFLYFVAIYRFLNIFWKSSTFPFLILILWAFQVALVVKESLCRCRRLRRSRFNPWVRKIPWRRKWQPTPVFLPGESHRKAWWATVHRVAKSLTWLKQLSMQYPYLVPWKVETNQKKKDEIITFIFMCIFAYIYTHLFFT